MADIPVSVETYYHKQLQVIPLGDEMPYDFKRPHRHEYFEFFIFAAGGGSHFIDFTEYAIQPHSVHIVFPGQIHLLKRTHAKGQIIVCTRQYLDSLSKVFYWQLFRKFYVSPCMTLKEQDFLVLAGIINKLEEEMHGNRCLSLEMQQCLLSVFLINCIRTGDIHAIPVHGKDYHQQDLEIFQRFSTLLDEYIQHKQGVSFFAMQLAMTPKTLNNSIRKITGKTCLDLIQERTLTEAKRLLLYTDKSAKEIAYELNFKDNSYFTRFFAKHTRYTPAAFKAFWEEKYHA